MPLPMAMTLHGKPYPKKNSKSHIAIDGFIKKNDKYPISGTLIIPNQIEAQGIY